MESRKHTRISVAVEVEVKHPLIGRRTVAAKDLSENGVYLWYPDAPFKLGSVLEVMLRGTPMIESRPSPSIKMRISRIDDNGIALSFTNKSAAHLWHHALGEPRELRVGEDLFRIFVAAIVRDKNHRVLTVQQNGRWLFPGSYLQVGTEWDLHLQSLLATSLNLTECTYLRTVLTHNDPNVVARESSVMSVFQLYSCAYSPSELSLVANSDPALLSPLSFPYTKVRWVANERQLDDLTFSDEALRELARSALQPSVLESSEPPENTDAAKHG